MGNKTSRDWRNFEDHLACNLGAICAEFWRYHGGIFCVVQELEICRKLVCEKGFKDKWKEVEIKKL